MLSERAAHVMWQLRKRRRKREGEMLAYCFAERPALSFRGSKQMCTMKPDIIHFC